MNNRIKLISIKMIHFIVWLIMASACFFILYCGITDTTSDLLWISIGLLVIETLVLAVNKWTCPLTPMAMRYTDERGDNFDIYLPPFVARYNKLFFGTLFIIGLSMVAYDLVK